MEDSKCRNKSDKCKDLDKGNKSCASRFIVPVVGIAVSHGHPGKQHKGNQESNTRPVRKASLRAAKKAIQRQPGDVRSISP